MSQLSNKTDTIDYEKYLNKQLSGILKMDITNKQKIEMISGFLYLLR